MKSLRRRLWTFAISAGAVLVIAAAAVSGLFQLAVQALPGYRAQIEDYVREVTGRPVRIDALRLTWRYYYPALELQGVALLGEAGGAVLLEAEQLRLGFGLTRLLRGELTPSRLELRGLEVDARIDRDGRWYVAGLEPAPGGSAELSREALRGLEGFGDLKIERCRLNLHDERRGESVSFGLSEARLQRGLLGTALTADIILPEGYGGQLRLQASIDGDWLDPDAWSGRWSAQVLGLSAGAWLQPYLARGAEIVLTDTELGVTGELKQGRTVSLDARLRAGPLRAQRSRHSASFDRLDAGVRVEFDEQGWTAEVKRFALTSVHGRWPGTRARVRYNHAQPGHPERPAQSAALEGDVEFLRLADLAPWLQMVRAPGVLATLDQAAGDLRGVKFELSQWDSGDPRYSLRGKFEQLALPAIGRSAGFAGAAGEFAADESGGRTILAAGPLTAELPEILVNPRVAFDLFEGEVEWRRRGDAWTVAMPQFRWELLTTRGSGRLALSLPDRARQSPALELVAQFSADDITAAKALIPRAWSGGLSDWLDRSILSGRADRATLEIKGALENFPFDRQPGIFALDIEVSGVLLAYQPDWPPVESLGAALTFRGNGLAIKGRGGMIGGNPIGATTARFPDFSTRELIIDGAVSGETARFYDFLSRSPLKDDLAALLENTTARGPAAVEIHIDIPIDRAEATAARGRVELNGVELRYAGLAEPIRNIRGSVGFGGPGIVAERIEGSLHGVPLAAVIRPRADGSSLLTADFRFALDPAGKGLSSFVPPWLRAKLAGASDFRAELPLATGESAPLVLSTDFSGMAIELPPPLAKEAAAAVPLTLAIGAAAGAAPLRVTAEYQERFGADLRFSRRGGDVALRRGALRFGAGAPPAAPKDGVVIGGTLPELDLKAWSQELEGSGLEQQAPLFRRAEVTVGRAAWGPYALRDTTYVWQPRPQDGFKLDLSGANDGEIVFDAAARLLTARLARFAPELGEMPDGGGDSKPVDPGTWPRVDLDIAGLSVNAVALGRAQLVTAAVDGGQTIERLALEGGAATLAAEGQWRRQKGRSSGALTFTFGSGDIAALLRAAGYARTLDAKTARLDGELRWPPTAGGIEWQKAQGTMNLAFTDGQLYTVDPGAGRVLGLFNFYALPRRLTLNFRDVLGQGLAFDRITGDFRLADGNAHTENLQIFGPSLRMDLAGRIGLAARDYDQSVTVYPDVSAGVTIGALALGGPVAGVLALIAQELLNKPLDQVTQLSYRVTGSWDNPQVERAEDPAPPVERRSGSPSQNP